jgi:hypothetical protein
MKVILLGCPLSIMFTLQTYTRARLTPGSTVQVYRDTYHKLFSLAKAKTINRGYAGMGPEPVISYNTFYNFKEFYNIFQKF